MSERKSVLHIQILKRRKKIRNAEKVWKICVELADHQLVGRSKNTSSFENAHKGDVGRNYKLCKQ